jgi:glycosyltransferase involved in cell wall biosynthesis
MGTISGGNGHRKLRIAQVAPLYESVPPQKYGGTERIVAYLTDELVARGHDVTLFASGDSETTARLVAPCARSLRLADCVDPLPHHYLMLEEVYRRAHDFDIVHFHVDYLHFPHSRRARIKHLTTLHGRLDIPDLEPMYREYRDMPLVSISDAQRAPLAWAYWRATVHHGLPLDLLPFDPGGGEHLVFVGRISPEKRVDRAVEIARRAGRRLVVAAKIDRADREYARTIEHVLAEPHVDYIGEVGDAEKGRLIGGAHALLFPIDWPEPFGLVMIEAMACGTPVVAFPGGSVREVIDDGVTGFIVDDIAAAAEAVERAGQLSRRRIRDVFERRFSAGRMADDYLQVYAQLIHEVSDGRSHAALPGLHGPGYRIAGG